MQKEYKKMVDDSLKDAFSRMGTDYDPIEKNTELNKIRKSISEDELEGGLADDLTIEKIAKKHKANIEDIVDQLMKGVSVEREHTEDINKALEIAMDHVSEDSKYYDKLEKIEGGHSKEETKEATGAASAGSYVGPLFGPMRKDKESKKTTKPKGGPVNEEETTEATTSSSVGAYDVAFGAPKKDPLKLSNPKTVYRELRAVRDTNFPKYGGPGGKYVRIKDKCKTFPYCNQGDINALEFFESDMVKEAIENISLRQSLPINVIKSIVLHEFEEKFIKEQEDEGFATFELPDNYKSPSAEEYKKEWLDSIKDNKAKYLQKELNNKEFDFDYNGLSGKVKIIDVGPKGKLAGFLGQADDYNFTDTKEVEVWVELDNLKFKGKDVPVEFYEMISRYLPPEEEEDSYRGDPVESAIIYSLDRVEDIAKYLGLYFTSIRINPYARFR